MFENTFFWGGDMQLFLSKNGPVISKLITNVLALKNLGSHYKLTRENHFKQNRKVCSPYLALIELLERYPDLKHEVAIIQDRKLTYEELLHEINQLSLYLHCIVQAKKGEKISICAGSSIEGIIAFFAMNQLGLVNARIFNGSKEEKMKSNLLNFNSTVLFTDSYNLDTLDHVIQDTKIKTVVIMDKDNDEQLCHFAIEHPNIQVLTWKQIQNCSLHGYQYYVETVNETDCASILYTSGSSGTPKPIIISNKVYTNMVDVVSKTTNIKKCDPEKVVGVVSHEYPYAAINSTIMILLMGKTLVMPEHNNGILDFNDLLDKKPQRIQAIPNFYKLLETSEREGKLKSNSLSYLKYSISGGETYSKSEKVEFLRFLRHLKANPLLIDGFGFGEMGSATALKFGLNNYFLLMNGIEAKAIDPVTKQELSLNKEGILCFAGPTIADGYYNDIESTKKSFIVDEKGKSWFVSDTYGSVHGCFRRLIQLGGRLREYFITGDGYGNFVKVYAGNVEDTILSNEWIEDCVVVPSDCNGLPTPVAYISLRKDCGLSSEEIYNLLKRQCSTLEIFAQPTRYELQESIERTPAGKKNYTYYRKLQFNQNKLTGD